MEYKYDVMKHYPKVSDEVIEGFRSVRESASVNECLPKNGAFTSDFRPVWPESFAVGRAFTVECRPGDNLVLQKVLTMLQPNDFCIIKCDGFTEAGGMWGGLMSNCAQQDGCVGLITDGSIRDSMMMKRIGFPVWSRGICVKRSTKATKGLINHPIVIGNVLVTPGDLIIADNDSIVCVEREIAEETLKKVLAREESETDSYNHIVAGNGHYNWTRYGFDKMYAQLGMTEEPD